MPLKQNTLLQGGKYKIVRFISAGGFGCTYEGEHVMLHKRIAIKEFFVKDFCNRDEQTSHVTVGTQSKVALVEKLRKKFVEEAVALSQFSHPNIVGVSDVFEENGTAYYVMDYIDGKSLHQIVNERGVLPESEAVGYIKDVADALAEVHKQNRLHLDIKPGNIMVGADGHAKLIDFGASKQYDEVDGENTSTLLGKTPGYAPIEQMGNRVQIFSAATDIYALGATFYKLVTGKTPADATEIADDEDALEPIPDSISPCIRKVIEKAMSVRRKDRQQSIAEFLSDFEINTAPTSTLNVTTNIVEESEKTILNEDIFIDEDEKFKAVDLGLSVLWAKCNIGAEKATEYGKLYGWGDVWGNTTTVNVSDYRKSSGINHLNHTQNDIASFNWKGQWRMPTNKEFLELIERCAWTWISLRGINGYKVTGPNGNSIFLPAAGYRNQYSTYGQNESGTYWTETADNFASAFALNINEKQYLLEVRVMYFGRSVRAVKDK